MPKSIKHMRRKHWRNENNNFGSTQEFKFSETVSQDGKQLAVFKPDGKPMYEAWKGPAFSKRSEFVKAEAQGDTRFTKLGMDVRADEAFKLAEAEWLA